MKLEDLEIYQIALRLGDEVWDIVIKWDYFEKKGLGAQLTDAADSISANISEGYGRLSPRDNRRFCLFARGSLFETATWISKAHYRKLIDDATHSRLMNECTNLKIKLWNYIQVLDKRSINEKGYGQS
ncbi:four helix bundle protein [Roseimarinus sediminis]|uniref:four helix bundle protein n=1 Tax=Roseimarinus sediminis TaxID=1610899 RepID=UPI003D220226